MTKAEWIFDMPPASGAQVGESLVEQVLQDSDEIDGIFARESGSNSGDQCLDLNRPVIVYYDLIEISGKEKKKFLKALDWKNLEKHINASKKDSSSKKFQNRLQAGLDHVNGSKLLCLKVSDSNATGLIGAENDKNNNFYLFSKAQLISSDDQTRQGSFGLGKAVHWGWSEISTVIISSNVPKRDDDNELSIRIFGRSELGPHQCKAQKWNQTGDWIKDGFFGFEKGHNNNHFSAESIWNDEELAKDLFLTRDEFDQGTSIMSIAYNDYQKDENETPKEILANLEENIKTWFWPGIANNKLEVKIRHFKNSEKLSEKKVSISDWENFVEASRGKVNASKIKEPGDLVEKIIPIEIPEKIGGSRQKLEGETKLRLLKGYDDNEKKDHIAHLRKNLCVVTYEKIKHDQDNPIFGVLLAGLAHPNGDNEKNRRVHDFLRDSEPPLHNNWKNWSKLKGLYKAPFTEKQQTFLRQISLEAAKLIKPRVDTQNADLNHLSKKFKFGHQGEDKNPKARVMNIKEHSFNNNKHIIKGKMTNLQFKNEAWTTSLECNYAISSGPKIPLEVKVINVSNGAQIDLQKPSIVRAENTVDEFDFELEALCSNLFSSNENENLDIELLEIPKEI